MPYMSLSGPDAEKVHNALLLKMTEGFAAVAAKKTQPDAGGSASETGDRHAAGDRRTCQDSYDRERGTEGR
jgi:hypothetical protein